MPDILILEVQLNVNKEAISIINIYNTSIEKKQAGIFIDIMIEALKLLHKDVFIIEDFNLYNINWDNCTVNPTI